MPTSIFIYISNLYIYVYLYINNEEEIMGISVFNVASPVKEQTLRTARLAPRSLELSHGGSVPLRPLASRWRKYTQSTADMSAQQR